MSNLVNDVLCFRAIGMETERIKGHDEAEIREPDSYIDINKFLIKKNFINRPTKVKFCVNKKEGLWKFFDLCKEGVYKFHFRLKGGNQEITKEYQLMILYSNNNSRSFMRSISWCYDYSKGERKPAENLIVSNFSGACGKITSTIVGLASQLSIVARRFTITNPKFDANSNGHDLVDIFNEETSRWETYDPSYNGFFTDKSGAPISLVEDIYSENKYFDHQDDQGIYMKQLSAKSPASYGNIDAGYGPIDFLMQYLTSNIDNLRNYYLDMIYNGNYQLDKKAHYTIVTLSSLSQTWDRHPGLLTDMLRSRSVHSSLRKSLLDTQSARRSK
jgi:hypothetical protein